MSDTMTVGRVAHLLSEAHTLMDELMTAELTACADPELLDALRSMQTLRRRLDYADYRVIREVEARHLPDQRGHASVARLLSFELHLDRGEAGGRARAASNAVGLRSLSSGEQLPTPFAHVAAAQAVGVVSQKQALLIAATIDKLPSDVQADRGEQIEAELVAYAHDFDAGTLTKIGAYCSPPSTPSPHLSPPPTASKTPAPRASATTTACSPPWTPPCAAATSRPTTVCPPR